MNARIFYHKRTGEPVQIVARAQTKPTFQEVICYQELTRPYDHFVMEKRQFFAEYVKNFDELPLLQRKELSKREDLPNKQKRISKGEVSEPVQEELRNPEDSPEDENTDSRIEKLLAFFDAPNYREKIKILEEWKEEWDEHMLNNIAVSLDLSIEDGVDGYSLILSELEIRRKFESDRGDRL